MEHNLQFDCHRGGADKRRLRLSENRPAEPSRANQRMLRHPSREGLGHGVAPGSASPAPPSRAVSHEIPWRVLAPGAITPRRSRDERFTPWTRGGCRTCPAARCRAWVPIQTCRHARQPYHIRFMLAASKATALPTLHDGQYTSGQTTFVPDWTGFVSSFSRPRWHAAAAWRARAMRSPAVAGAGQFACEEGCARTASSAPHRIQRAAPPEHARGLP